MKNNKRIDKKIFATKLNNKKPEDKSMCLGWWCLETKEKIEKPKNIKIVRNPWNCRKRLKEDSKKIENLFEDCLKKISFFLNNYHQENKTGRYWRILVGPWLLEFLPVVYNRWQIAQVAFNQNKKSKLVVAENKNYNPVSFSTLECTRKYFDHEWNNWLFKKIAESIKWKYTYTRNSKNLNKTTSLDQKKSFVSQIKNQIKKIISFFCLFFKKNDQYFLHTTYLNSIDWLSIHLKLRLFPLPFYFPEKFQGDLRKKNYQKYKLVFDSKNFPTSFLTFLQKIIFDCMPSFLLADFKKLKEATFFQYLPQKPRTIFTSNSFFYNDPFKVWCAEKILKGTKLVIGQHGGHYGSGKFGTGEWFESSIANVWLSWGWIDKKRKNIIPIGILKRPIFQKQNIKTYKTIVIISSLCFDYPYIASSVPTTWESWEMEVNFNIEIYKNLPFELQKITKVRLFPTSSSNFETEKWLNAAPEIKFAKNKGNLLKYLKKDSLAIVTYHGTPMLEVLYANIPCVCIWKKEHYEISNKYIPIFKKLNQSNILFHDVREATQHIGQKPLKILDWWNSKKTQAARNLFLSFMARQNKNLCSELCEHLKT